MIYPVDSAIAEPGGQATILNKQMENLELHPSPQIKNGKMVRFCPSRGFILDFEGGWGGVGWGFAVPFILSKVVGPQSLI